MATQVTANLLEPWLQLDNKIVMVTGASSGLGREFCLHLAKAGCKIVAAARRVDKLKSLCDQINHLSAPSGCSSSGSAAIDHPNSDSLRAVSVELDVTADVHTINASVKKAWDAFGHIDALINNAGIRGEIRSVIDLSEDEWNEVMRTNLTGAWLVAKCISGHMRDARQGGSIVNISSISGLNRPQFRGGVAYSASKAAMDSMTKVMALEFGEFNIRVNSIAPGLFPSQITEDIVKKDWLKNVASKTIPLKTFGTTDPALTSLVSFLVHESSSYISGNVFIVDAGYTLPGFPIFSSL